MGVLVRHIQSIVSLVLGLAMIHAAPSFAIAAETGSSPIMHPYTTGEIVSCDDANKILDVTDDYLLRHSGYASVKDLPNRPARKSLSTPETEAKFACVADTYWCIDTDETYDMGMGPLGIHKIHQGGPVGSTCECPPAPHQMISHKGIRTRMTHEFWSHWEKYHDTNLPKGFKLKPSDTTDYILISSAGEAMVVGQKAWAYLHAPKNNCPH